MQGNVMNFKLTAQNRPVAPSQTTPMAPLTTAELRSVSGGPMGSPTCGLPTPPAAQS